MTTTTRNEAAERLHTDLWDGMDPPVYDLTRAMPIISDALAAERRATVERIREALDRLMLGKGEYNPSDMRRVLDEEAAR